MLKIIHSFLSIKNLTVVKVWINKNDYTTGCGHVCTTLGRGGLYAVASLAMLSVSG